ncbi:MAG: helix-turn-helix domain-containing protein [Dehalococcoidia bacterium]
MATTATPHQKPSSAIGEGLLTERQAGELLGFTATTMRISRMNGKLAGSQAPPWLKLGKSVRYRRADLDAWLEKAAVECCAPAAYHA